MSCACKRPGALAAACVDNDWLHSGSLQAWRPWLVPDVVFRLWMIRYVIEGLGECLLRRPHSNRSVRVVPGHTSYCTYVRFRQTRLALLFGDAMGSTAMQIKWSDGCSSFLCVCKVH